MLKRLRQIVLLCALGIIVIFSGIQPMQAAPDLAMAAMDGPCCPDDCPPTPDCAPACAAMMICGAGSLVLPGSVPVVIAPLRVDDARLAGADRPIPRGLPLEGLRRPPKL